MESLLKNVYNAKEEEGGGGGTVTQYIGNCYTIIFFKNSYFRVIIRIVGYSLQNFYLEAISFTDNKSMRKVEVGKLNKKVN